METVTFDSTRCSDSRSYVDNGGLRLSCQSKPGGVFDWLKNGFVTRSKTEAACICY